MQLFESPLNGEEDDATAGEPSEASPTTTRSSRVPARSTPTLTAARPVVDRNSTDSDADAVAEASSDKLGGE